MLGQVREVGAKVLAELLLEVVGHFETVDREGNLFALEEVFSRLVLQQIVYSPVAKKERVVVQQLDSVLVQLVLLDEFVVAEDLLEVGLGQSGEQALGFGRRLGCEQAEGLGELGPVDRVGQLYLHGPEAELVPDLAQGYFQIYELVLDC